MTDVFTKSNKLILEAVTNAEVAYFKE